MTYPYLSAECWDLRNAVTTQMTEAGMDVLRKNGTPEDGFAAMQQSLSAAMLRWFKDNYRCHAEIEWPCADCKAHYRLCQTCMKRAVIEEIDNRAKE
jgi:hypothetical protein